MGFNPRASVLCLLLCAGVFSQPALAEKADLNSVLTGWDRDEHADLRGVVVLQEGQIIAERYYNGETSETLRDVRSAGKSITALLVGAAMDRGKLGQVSDRVDKYWPTTSGSAIGDASIDDVLTMRSGLASFDDDPASPGNEDKLDAATDPVRFLLKVPRATPPGTLYRYNSLTAYIAGMLVEKATGQDLQDFARAALFEPLGVVQWQWGRDDTGHTKGQGNLSLSARDLAKVGQLVLDQGKYQDKQLISAAWIAAALAPHVSIAEVDHYADYYGYFWYSKIQVVADREVPVFFASGNGGNKIYVMPSMNMVVVVTSSAYGHGYGQLRSETILKAILTAFSRNA
ncbi:MAG: serine hydrolase [Collimonas sp.]|uniref:serine hydrolase domain-containing protein n=1 Tax=Collimonas sp. TaxID=1963772 RepID=UPI0032672409